MPAIVEKYDRRGRKTREEQELMKKVQKQLKRALSMVLALTMVVGMLSGCGLGGNTTPESTVVQDAVTEVEEITLSSKAQDTFLLSAGEKSELQFDTTKGTITDVTMTPDDKTLVPYQYYTVTITLTAGDNESFAKSAAITLDGVTLQIKEWAADRLVIEYTTLALPETVTTDEMSKVTAYGEVASETGLGTAKVQALLDCELTVFSEDGQNSYVVKKGFVPLFMVPSFVANGELEQIKDGENVQIIKEHGEEDFAGAEGQWYKVAYNGKVGYFPAAFVKDVRIQANSEAVKTPEPTSTPKKVAQTRPAVNPTVPQSTQKTVTGNTSNSDSDDDSDSDSDSNTGNNTDNNGSNNNGSNNSPNNNGSDNNGSDGKDNIEKTVYYQINFALGGGISAVDALLPKALMVASNYVIDINQLATPSVPGYVFESWYYDSALTKQVQSGDTITGNLTLFAKLREITAEDITADTDTVQGADTYISSVDQDAKSFQITLLKQSGECAADPVDEIAKLRNLEDPDTSILFMVSDPETVTIDETNYEKYVLSFGQLEEGATYQMQLLDSNYVYYFESTVQPAAVRLYNFTTAMPVKAVENLELNSDLVYLKKTEVSYTEGSDYLSGLFQVKVDDNKTELNTTDGKGSFTYTGSQKIGVGTTVVIYDGAEAPKLGADGLSAAEQYDGNAAYVTISKVQGNTYYYGVAEAEDVLFTPDVLPVNIADDEDGRGNNTVQIDMVKLDYSADKYAEMGLNADTTVDVGDYLAFYEGSIETATELTYGQITDIAVSGEDTILTYTEATEDEVMSAMTVYGTEDMNFELDEETAKQIEEQMEQQAIDSGFAAEAADYLATVALATDEMQSLTDQMGLQSLSLTREDGTAATQSDIATFASNSVQVEGLSVNANISRKLENLAAGDVKNGARAQLEVSFNVKIGSGKNQMVLKVAATFEQEILLNLNIHGKIMWGKKWIFPYIKDYRITTNIDVGSYTGVGITATIVAEGKEPEYDWSTVDKNLSDQIHDLMDTKDKFFNQDINSTGGGLAEKYAAMLENNPDWIDLINVNIFSSESKILAGIIVVGVQGDFVVSAKVNIMMGMTFNYGIAKRYSFTLNVFSKTSSSDSVDLKKSSYNFDLYVMGTLGLRAGIRLTVYTGLFSKKVACIGVTAEAGAYIQMWGYFYYSTRWEAGSDKKSSASGAMLMEVGAYLEIRFLASAFGGTFKYAPVLYDKYWPLWNLGSAENVYGFNYESTEGEEDDMDIDMAANGSVALPTDRMNMSYMNLRNGDTSDKTYTYSNFDITTTGNFAYDNGVIRVIPQDGSNEEQGTVTLTWKGAPLSFTSKPLSVTLDLHWYDPSRIQSVSYELHGGTAYTNGEALEDGIPAITVITGGKMTAPDVEIKRDGYTFDGWYLEAAGKTAWNFATDKVKTNLVLHAKWTPIVYKIAYELNGGTNADTNVATYTIEDNVKLADPTRAGYEFAGWNTAADGTGSKVIEIPVGSIGDQTFYAQWMPVEQSYEIHHYLEKLDGSGYDDVETITETAKTDETVTVGAEQSRAYTGFTYDAAHTEESGENTGVIPAEGTLALNLYYSRNSYTVTLKSGFGTENEVSVRYKDTVPAPDELTRAGYTFGNWYVAAETPRVWDFASDIITENTTIYATWTANVYNVVFDRQNGVGGDDNVQATYDSAMPGIGVPGRAGYQFTGYYDAEEGGRQYYAADGSSTASWDKSESETDNFVLYAHWEANTYEVAFDANNGEGTMDNQSFTYDAEGQLSKNTLTREGYLFSGWAKEAKASKADYADEASVSNLTTDEGGIVTLYAVWTPITYTVKFDGNGATDGSMSSKKMTYDKTSTLKTNAYERTGYHFLGWALTADAAGVEYENLASVTNLTSENGATVTLYAVWEANIYQVVFRAGGGEGTMEPQSFTYDEAAKALSKNLFTKTGYSFRGWAEKETDTWVTYKDEEKVQNLLTEDGAVLTLFALWNANTYTLSFDSNKGEGSSTPTTAVDRTVTYGKTYGTLPAVSRNGYTFDGWYTEKEGGEAILADNVVDITENTTLYAHWTVKKYTVSFDSNKGKGSTTPTEADAIEVTYDTTYGDLPEVSRDGYTFNGWYTTSTGGSKVTADTAVKITADRTLYAQWTANTYEVTFNANNGTFADGTTEKVITQTFDTAYVTPEEEPTRDGYNFVGWWNTDYTHTVTTAEDHEVKAVWKQIVKCSVTIGGYSMNYTGTPVYWKIGSDGNVGSHTQGSEDDYNIKLEDNVLTLNNVNITNKYGEHGAIHAEDVRLTIVLEGTNTITQEIDVDESYGIYVEGNLTITGTGSLTVPAKGKTDSCGICVAYYHEEYGGNLTIDGATVTTICNDVTSHSDGILVYYVLEIKNGATVTAVAGNAAEGNSWGIFCGQLILDASSGTTKCGAETLRGVAVYMMFKDEPEYTNCKLLTGGCDQTEMTWGIKEN